MSAFPQHVDVIIIGTSLTNSILAAACSRIGKTVLHLDENNYYGNYEASFTFQQLIDWIKQNHPQDPSLKSIPQDLLCKSRMFCLDLAPRFLFSNGDLVDLLVKSNVARYHEFKNNIRILCLIGDNEIHVMPCRRSEVFTSPLLSNLSDKRRLMKFIESCVNYRDESELSGHGSQELSDISENGDRPIGVYLEERGLKPALREYIINSIAMIHPTDTTKEACKRIKKFMFATEKYGRSPFLFPLYGCGEFPQSFCRMSAVFGGVYCLSTEIKDASKASAVETSSSDGKFSVKFGNENHKLTSDMLVVEQDSAIKLNLQMKKDLVDNGTSLSRAILITNKSIVACDEDKDDDNVGGDGVKSSDLLSFLRIPPNKNKNQNIVYLIELNSSALICPKGFNVVYLWTKSNYGQTAESDLKPTIDRLFPATTTTSDDCILWRFHYRQACKLRRSPDQEPTEEDSPNLSAGLFVTCPTFDDVDYAGIIQEAERLFKQMCPNQEFLPRAPDPDEIVHSA